MLVKIEYVVDKIDMYGNVDINYTKKAYININSITAILLFDTRYSSDYDRLDKIICGNMGFLVTHKTTEELLVKLK